MPDIGLPNIGWLLLALAGVWALQLVLSLYQSKRFHRRVFELRKEGDKASVGMAGSNWKRKVYAVLVVDEDRETVHAHKLAGFTVFADLEPVPELVGLPMARFEKDEPVSGVTRKVWTAFQNAAGYIRDADEKAEQPESDSAVVVENQSMPTGYSLSDSKQSKSRKEVEQTEQ
jgi:DNA-binding transcriptional regulator of glucitol operon